MASGDVRFNGEGIDPDGYAVVVYTVHGWQVTLRSRLSGPFNGAEQLTINLTDADTVDSAIESDGLTFEVMRAIPLADARRRLTNLKRSQAGTFDLPERVQTHDEWQRFAQSYLLARQRSRHPLRELEAATGVSRKTLSSRVQTARERGYLEGPPGKPADRLGPSALNQTVQGSK